MTARLPTAVRAVLGNVFAYVLVEPVRSGRLRRDGWPPGLSTVVAVALATSAAMVALTVASGAIRRHATLLYAGPTSTLPRWTIGPLTAALALALGCLYAGVLHVRPLVRVPALVLICSVVTTVVGLEPLDRSVPAIAAAGVLLVVAVARWRASFAWWEPVLGVGVIGAALAYTLAVVQADLGAGVPSTPLDAFDLATTTVWLLAEPFAVLAGATVSELLAATAVAVCAAGGSVVAGVRPRLVRVLLPASLVLLVGVRAAQVMHGVVTDDEYGPGLLLGGALVLAVPAAALVVLSRSGRHALLDVDPDAGLGQWRRWALLLAGLLVAMVDWPFLLAQVSASFGLRAASRWFLDLRIEGEVLNPTTFLAVAMLALAAYEHRRRGRWPLLLLVFAWVFVAQVVDTAFDLDASGNGSLALASLLAAVTALVLGVRGRLSLTRAVPLGSVLLLSALFPYRDTVTDPLTALLALGGVTVALVVGVVWRLLTDLSFGNGATERFPRTSRVLLVLANAVVGASGVALLALQGGLSTTDLREAEGLGDTQLGFALVVAVVLAQLFVAWSGASSDVAPDSTAGALSEPAPSLDG